MSGRTWSVGNPFDGLKVVEAFEASAEQSAAAVERKTARRVLESAVGLGPGGHQDGVREVVGRLEPATFMSQHNPAAHCRAILLAAVESGRLLLLRREPIVLPTSWRVSPRKAEAPTSGKIGPDSWIEIVVTDSRKVPYTGSYALELPGGRKVTGRMNLAGTLRWSDIDSGTCRFTYPDPDDSSLPTTPTTHVIKLGDCLSSLAQRYGLPSYRDIYDHGNNVALKRLRPNPNLLLPGDEVFIPKRPVTTYPLATNQVHRLPWKRPQVTLRLTLQTPTGQSAAGRPYRLLVAGQEIFGALGDGGQLIAPIPADATQADLWIDWRGKGLPEAPMQLALGHLDPVDTPTGVQARLTNLGLRRGDFSGRPGRQTRAALHAFQKKSGLSPTGRIDDDVVAALVNAHDANEGTNV